MGKICPNAKVPYDLTDYGMVIHIFLLYCSLNDNPYMQPILCMVVNTKDDYLLRAYITYGKAP